MEKKKRSFSELVDAKKSASNPIPAPAIAYFARRGGLSPTARTYPPRLSNAPFDHVAESSNGTATVEYHVGLGLEKYFSDIKEFRRAGASNGVRVDDELVRKNFKRINFLQGSLPSGSPEESAKEAFDSIRKRWPELQKYPSSKILRRRGRRKDELRQQRLRFVREADKQGVDVVEYLDTKGATLPLTWRVPAGWRRSPNPWRLAYDDPKWRIQVQKLVSNLRGSSS